MFRIFLTAALMVASFSASAQQIKIFSSCRENPRMIHFQREAASGDVFERYNLGSACPSKQMPKNRLEIGHYQFDDLPIRANEEFLVSVQTDGVITFRQVLTQTNNRFFVSLGEGDELSIIISEKLGCNCSEK